MTRSSAAPVAWLVSARTGRPGRDRAEDRTQDGTLNRNRPADFEGLRPRAPRPGDLPDRRVRRSTTRPRPRSTSATAWVCRSRSWPRQFGRTRSSIYRVINEMRAARHPRDQAGVHRQRQLRRPRGRGRDPRPRCPSRPTARPRAGPRPPRVCPPTWPASTKSRCWTASRRRTCSAR